MKVLLQSKLMLKGEEKLAAANSRMFQDASRRLATEKANAHMKQLDIARPTLDLAVSVQRQTRRLRSSNMIKRFMKRGRRERRARPIRDNRGQSM